MRVVTYLTILLIVDCFAGPVLDDELSKLQRQERNLGKRFDLHLLFNIIDFEGGQDSNPPRNNTR